jgi:DNA processing protein
LRSRQHDQLASVARGDYRYPLALDEVPDAPATLYVAGSPERLLGFCGRHAVALVGARKASGYGLGIARALGRGLAESGVVVVSGMAHGIDAAAHRGALDADGFTVAVLAGGADTPYPPSHGALYGQILKQGLIVSEQPAGSGNQRWRFLERNRIIAGLAQLTVVVEAGEGSGALVTAAYANSFGRVLGAVPGRVGTAQALGPNALLAAGARVIRGAQDVLDLLYGPGVVTAPKRMRAPLEPEHAALLAAIAGGEDTSAALSRAGIAPERGLVLLASLELGGHVVRGPGGRYTVPAA